MKAEYDFARAKYGSVGAHGGRTDVTISLDEAVLRQLTSRADAAGIGYEALINDALKEYLVRDSINLEETLRRVIREEMGR